MRWTRKVSAWPVAFTGAARFQGPKVDNKGRVVGFHTNWKPERKFCLDMAAFAVNIDVLIHEKSKAQFRQSAVRGHLEPTFLSEITTVEDLEPLADNCTKVRCFVFILKKYFYKVLSPKIRLYQPCTVFHFS